MVFDEAGERLTPTHAVKKKASYPQAEGTNELAHRFLPENSSRQAGDGKETSHRLVLFPATAENACGGPSRAVKSHLVRSRGNK
jgi:hypothetical protein